MSHRSRPLRAAATALLLATSVALTACGGGDDGVSGLSSSALLKEAKKQVDAAETITLSGESTADGIAVDMSFVGDDATGTINLGGDELELLRVGGEDFFKATDDFWINQAGDQGQQIAELIGDSWVPVPADDPNFGEITALSDRAFINEEILDPDGSVKKGKEKTVEGVECVSLGDDEGTLYLAKDDGRPIALAEDGKTTLTFSYDDVDVPAKPGADETFDISQLG